ncbi:MAG: adenylyltransferase [Caulobacter sp.]|nr:adenylyltransferase [Caulobacter sp.]
MANGLRIAGAVRHGQQIGRTIGFPTANVGADPAVLPEDGIYASFSRVDGGPLVRSVSYVGRRPTVDGQDRELEVFILDFNGDLYDRHLETILVARVRGDRKFASLSELKDQIQKDCAVARSLLAEAWSSPEVCAA